MMERELVPKWTIEEMALGDVESATEMRLKSWLDTYINDDLGVTREWIEQGNGFQLSEDIVLGVVTYNERAKAFYKKWGFEEVPDSESLFEGLMPEIVMIRKGGQL